MLRAHEAAHAQAGEHAEGPLQELQDDKRDARIERQALVDDADEKELQRHPQEIGRCTIPLTQLNPAIMPRP